MRSFRQSQVYTFSGWADNELPVDLELTPSQAVLTHSLSLSPSFETWPEPAKKVRDCQEG